MMCPDRNILFHSLHDHNKAIKSASRHGTPTYPRARRGTADDSAMGERAMRGRPNSGLHHTDCKEVGVPRKYPN